VFALIGPKRFDVPWKDFGTRAGSRPRTAPRSASISPTRIVLRYAVADDKESSASRARTAAKCDVIRLPRSPRAIASSSSACTWTSSRKCPTAGTCR
jgi:hypothetical protein